jgi:hypothetical protein
MLAFMQLVFRYAFKILFLALGLLVLSTVLIAAGVM